MVYLALTRIVSHATFLKRLRSKLLRLIGDDIFNLPLYMSDARFAPSSPWSLLISPDTERTRQLGAFISSSLRLNPADIKYAKDGADLQRQFHLNSGVYFAGVDFQFGKKTYACKTDRYGFQRCNENENRDGGSKSIY